METLFIKGTEDTPTVEFNYNSGIFSIFGRSLPEDVSSFYKPAIDWLQDFSTKPKDGSNFEFKLEYFNTASSKILLDILLKLEEIASESGVSFKISWYSQESDTDMLEAGEEYADIVELPFEYISY
jgi:hypothetical protein